MSFALGDFVSAGKLAWDLYYKCWLVVQDAPHEFRSLVDSLQSVKIAMHDLEEEVKNENSALSRAGEDRVRNVVAMVGALMRTLKAVEKIVNRYQVIVGPATDLKSYSVKLWGKIKWVQEVKAIEDLKQKLMFHTGAITLVLLTVGNASLSRMETIMNTLVMSIAMPPASELENTSTDQTTSELPEPEIQSPVELPSGSQSPPAELPGGPVSLTRFSPSHELQITAEETIAVKEIFAEAERRLVEHGRPALSRANTIKKPPPVRIPRKPIARSQATHVNHPPTAGVSKLAIEPQRQTQTPNPEIGPRPPPVPAKIPLDSLEVGARRSLEFSTLGSSINYAPSAAIEKVLLQYKAYYSDRKNWPSDFTLWLRIAEWWFLKGELSKQEQGRLTDQAYVDFVKCSWILSYIARLGNDGFSYDMPEEHLSHYYDLLKKIEIHYAQQDPNTPIPNSSSDLFKLDFQFLELTQPEEDSGLFTSPHHLYLDVFYHVDLGDEKVHFQSFVALEFGLSRPVQPPVEMARSYLLSFYFSAQSRTAWIYVCNQTGSLGIVKSMDRRNIGPEMDGLNIRDWVGLEFNGQIVYAGFSSAESAVPYAIEYNSVRREILERPTCLFEITVEKAQYRPQGHEVNPIGVGPAPLALKEMMKVDDDRARYRAITMRDHFTTKAIPLHVIKIIQSPSSPVRVQLWWPTFDIPREDLRHYMRKHPNFIARMRGKEEFYLNPHIRIAHTGDVRVGALAGTIGMFVEIKYRTIAERLLDIDLKMRSDRMLDVIFSTPEDASEFIRHAGGTAEGATEMKIFRKVTQEKEIRLFRRVDGTTRLSYKESDTHCNFIVDQSSAYKLTPEGSMSLWSIMWSPFGSIQRSMNNDYLADSIDLGVFNTPERDNFISALSFSEQYTECASMKITNFVAVRAGMVGKFAKALRSLRSSAAEAMLVLRMTKDVLQVAVFGEIIYAECSKLNENLRLAANVSTYAERLSSGGSKLSVQLSVREATLHSFNRERSIMMRVRNPEVVAAEVGGMSFVVHDISEWRAAATRLKLEHTGLQR